MNIEQLEFELKPLTESIWWHQFIIKMMEEGHQQQQHTTIDYHDYNNNNNLNKERKLYSSSSFYSSQHPTIQEQLDMCRKIVKTLVNEEANSRSKGREMFEKRVQKSHKWIHSDSLDDYDQYYYPTISNDPPKLKLVLDPRTIIHSNQDNDINDNESSIDDNKTKGKQIAQILLSPDLSESNKGVALFTKRRQSSENWIVNNNYDVNQLTKQEQEQRQEDEGSSSSIGMRFTLKSPCCSSSFSQMSLNWRNFNRSPQPFVSHRE